MRPLRFEFAIIAAALALLALCGIGVLCAAPPWQLATRRAQRLAAELASVPPEEAPARIQELVALGDEGIALSVEQLDQREGLSRASRSALRRQVERWELLPTETVQPQAERLARELARQAPSFSPGGRRAAREVASTLLAASFAQEGFASGSLRSDCERTLQMAAKADLEQRPQRDAAGVRRPSLSLASQFDLRIEAAKSPGTYPAAAPFILASPPALAYEPLGPKRNDEAKNEETALLSSAPASLFDVAQGNPIWVR